MSINPEQSSVFESNTENLDSLRKELDIQEDSLKVLEEEIAIFKKSRESVYVGHQLGASDGLVLTKEEYTKRLKQLRLLQEELIRKIAILKNQIQALSSSP
ncbi:MAG: hypothetical protein MUF85_02475 [Patescibacteria group bacterium]|jgi:hypothetical protein|nr:hypothetical protein [Patescibacteria group bacterium]